MRHHGQSGFRVLALLLVFAIGAGCQTTVATAPDRVTPAAEQLLCDRLFFGRNIPAGGTVSDADWEAFLREVVTPHFPDGLTVWQGYGQWLDPRGQLTSEQVFVLEVFHPRSQSLEAAIAVIATEYKKRFRQDAVLRATSDSTIRFY